MLTNILLQNKTSKKFYIAYQILSPKSKKNFWVVLFLSVIGMFLEVLGIGMIFPAIETFTKPHWVSNYPQLNSFSIKVGETNFIIIGLLTLVGIFFIKNIFLTYLAYFHSKFSFGVQEETSSFLYESYLSRSYEFFLSKNSSELLRNATGEVNSFVGYVLQPILIIIAETLVLIAIMSLLIFVQPIACLTVILFVGLIGWAFNKFTTVRVTQWGNERQKHEGKKIQYLQEGFDGIKMIKLLKNPSELLKKFNFHTHRGAIAGKNQYAMQQIPRLLLEFLSIVALSILAFILFSTDSSGESSVSKLGMIAFGMIRMMPSVARIVNSYQSISYGLPCVQVLSDELNNWEFDREKKVEDGQQKFRESFTIKGISYSYPGSKSKSLEDISIEVRKGTCVGILGKSGSGKSTLIDIALGLLKPTKGKLFIDGKEIGKEINPNLWKGTVGYVPQEINLGDDSLRNNVAFGVENCLIDDEKVWKSLSDANLFDFAKDLPLGLNTNMGEKGVRLSGGQRQRVGIARALYKNPNLVVFDEATSSLDIETEKSIMDTIYKLKKDKTFIIVAHRLSTIEKCDVVYKIEKGQVVDCGSFEKVMKG